MLILDDVFLCPTLHPSACSTAHAVDYSIELLTRNCAGRVELLQITCTVKKSKHVIIIYILHIHKYIRVVHKFFPIAFQIVRFPAVQGSWPHASNPFSP